MTTATDGSVERDGADVEADDNPPDDGQALEGLGWTRLLGPTLQPYRWRLIGAAAFGALGQLLLVLIPLIQKVIVDDTILAAQRDRQTWLIILLAVGFVSFVANYVRRTLSGRAALDVQRDLQVRVHHHLQHLDPTGRDRLRTGDIMSRATADLTLIQMFLQQFAVTVGNLALLVGSAVVMLLLSPLLGLVIIACIPVFWYTSVLYSRRSFPANWMDQRYQGAVAGVVEEAITGVRIVKAFGQEERELHSLTESARQLYQSRIRTARINARFTAALQAIPTFGQLGVLALGGWLAMRGNLTLGVFLAFASYVAQLAAPVRMLSSVMSTSQQARAGAARVVELLDTESTVQERSGAPDFDSPHGAVRVEHVTFGFGDEPPVLNDVSIDIRPGERVAIVGGSGSGKSTLALLLARFYDPHAGAVLIDGCDLRDHSLRSVRQTVGMVFEDSFLFSNTIRYNIAFGKPGSSDAEIEKAAMTAQAHEFIMCLPSGYDTVIGERGFTLSGGQRQRIALARAALSNPKVLVLDDATSAVDARTEEAIHHSLAELMADRTMVLIAHRHSTLQLADRVIVLDQGRIVGEGGTGELMASSPSLRALLTGPEYDEQPIEREAVTELDPDAWPHDVSREGAPKLSSRSLGGVTQSMSGAGGGLDGRMTVLAKLTRDSPSLAAAAEALPPLVGDPKVDLAALRQPEHQFSFLKVLRPFRVALLVGAGLVVIDAMTTLATPQIIRWAVDDGISSDSGRTLAFACLVLLGVQIVSWLNAIAMNFQTARTAERILYSLRVRTFAHLQRLSLDYYDEQMAGKIMTRMTSDIDAFAQLVQQGLLTALVSILSCVGVTVLLISLSPSLTLAVAIVFIPLAVGTLWFRRSSGRNYLVARERLSTLYAEMQESLAGARISQAYCQQATMEAHFSTLANSYNESRKRSIELVARYFPFIQLASTVAKAIALAAGASKVASGEITAGVLIAFLIYVDQFFAPIQQLSSVFDQWLQANVAVGQLTHLLRRPTTTPQSARPVQRGRLKGDVRFEDVELAYASTGLVAMRDVSLEIPAGQVVALVGTTGAGKSTLVKLVARFYDPTRGHIYVDGVRLQDLDLSQYRQQLGYVPQESFLFSGTVRSNIAYGRPSASDLEVERAARAVGAHEFVLTLPHGYHTPVTEEGRSLSAGQKQMIGLARAELVDPSILLLDEATANLDLATEARVQRAMALVARDRTTLLIAHRLQTARVAERILVIDDGRIVEDGTHDELLDLGGNYASLWEAFRHSTAER